MLINYLPVGFPRTRPRSGTRWSTWFWMKFLLSVPWNSRDSAMAELSTQKLVGDLKHVVFIICFDFFPYRFCSMMLGYVGILIRRYWKILQKHWFLTAGSMSIRTLTTSPWWTSTCKWRAGHGRGRAWRSTEPLVPRRHFESKFESSSVFGKACRRARSNWPSSPLHMKPGRNSMKECLSADRADLLGFFKMISWWFGMVVRDPGGLVSDNTFSSRFVEVSGQLSFVEFLWASLRLGRSKDKHCSFFFEN